MSNTEEKPENSHFLLYQDDNGVTNVHVRFDDTKMMQPPDSSVPPIMKALYE